MLSRVSPIQLVFFSLSLILILAPSGEGATRTLIVGGDSEDWQQAGDIPATVIIDAKAVAETNAPGGVINFTPQNRPGWIFPKQADTSKNLLRFSGDELLPFDDETRGGSVTTPSVSFKTQLEDSFQFLYDGDETTALAVKAESAGQSVGTRGLLFDFDLGAIFGINRVSFFPTPTGRREFMKGYELYMNDGSPKSVTEAGLVWGEPVAQENQNEEADVDIRFPTRFVRFIRLKSTTASPFELAEFQVFSDGFVPRATYLSSVFDLGAGGAETAILGNLRWVQEKVGDPGKSKALVRTRTGSDPSPVEYRRIGLQSSGRLEIASGGVFEAVPIDALWRKSEDVEDERLRALVDTLLDDPERDGREVLFRFASLPLADRVEITLDREAYEDLDGGEQSVIRDDLTNWSPWSPAYPLEGTVDEADLGDSSQGTPIQSPTPRRFFQFAIEFENQTFDAATGIGGLAVDVTTPAYADSLIAEILPRRTEVGRKTEFVYAVLYKSNGEDAGFDRFEVQTPVRTDSIGTVELVAADGRVTGASFAGRPLQNLPIQEGEFFILDVTDTKLVVGFPRVQQDNTLLKLQFRNSVLRVGTQFGGRAFNSDDPLFGQPALGGNAADLSREGLADPDDQPVGTLNARGLFVDVPVAKDLLVNVGAEPRVLTPNGDGINDESAITYDITNSTELAVEVDIFDLSGRRVWTRTGRHSSGRFQTVWDGRDQNDQVVPPGNYIFAITLDAGAGEEKVAGVVSVVF